MFNIAEYRRRERRLSDYLPWAALIGPETILNKDGSFLAVLRYRGPDLDGCGGHERVAARARLNNALRRLGSSWCLHAEARRRPSRHYPRSTFPDPMTAAIDAERRTAFEAEGNHYESDQYLALTYLAPEERAARGRSLFVESADGGRSVDYRREWQSFEERVNRLADLLAAFMPDVRRLGGSDLLTYLHDAVSSRRLQVAVPSVPFYLDATLTDDDLAGGFEPRLGEQHLRTVSVRAYCPRTVPGLLGGLDRLALPYRWAARWLPMDRDRAERHLSALRRQWFARRKGLATLLKEVVTKEASALEDSDSVNKSADADEALQYLGADLCSYGYLTLTVTVTGPDPQTAAERAAAVQRVVDGAGLVSKVETANAVEAWLGSLPGHAYADVRRPVLSSLNLCDLIPVGSVWPGPDRCDHLNGPPLLQARTQGSTPFRLSLHQGDVGHAMVCGPTGAGKSTLLNLIAAQWRRYPNAQVYFFDKGASCKVLTLAVGGDFYDLGAGDGGAAGGGLAFQPLGRADEPAERLWAQEWLLDVLGREGVAASPALRAELWRALELLGGCDRRDRTLGGFADLLQDRAAVEALRRYTLAGPYGHLLDADADGLDAGAWQAFETEHLMRHPAAAAAVLTYLFHRLEERFASEGAGGRPTLLILDEAWAFLSDGLFAAKISEWLKVLRKRNVAVVFATQSLSDVRQSAIAPALIENCPTRLLLPNGRALEPDVRAAYAAFGLTDAQLRLLASAVPKKDYYYQSRGGDRLFDLGLGPLAIGLCGASSHVDRTLADRLLREHPRHEFATRFLSESGRAAAAERLAASGPPVSSSQS